MKRKLLACAIALAVTACSGPQVGSGEKTAKADAEVQAQQVAVKSGIDTSGMDKNVKAADDMFRYTNGHWVDSHQIPDDKSRWGTFNVLAENSKKQIRAIIEEVSKKADSASGQQIGNLYNSYMNEALADELGMKPLHAEFAAIDKIQNKSDVVKYFARAGIMSDTSPAAFWVYADKKDPNTNVVYLVQDGLGLPDRDYYFDDTEKAKKTQAKYQEYLKTLAELGGVKGDTAKVYALEKAMAEHHWTKVENRDSEKTYNRLSNEEINGWMGDIGADAWQDFLASAGVAGQKEYIVYQPSYLQALPKIVKETDLDTWKLYFKLHLMDSYAAEMHKALFDARFAFRSAHLYGVKEPSARWKRAVSALNNNLGELLGQEYVARHFPPEAKARMKTLVQNLINAYGVSIDNLEWMGDETKVAAKDKLSKFRTKIGYPDTWRDYSALSLKADDLVGNLQRARQFEHDYMIDQLGKPVDRERWGMSPQTVNAYFNPILNEIVFPAAILQPPFFNLEADDAVNYGAIGAVIGHEIGHGFDDQGSRYDGDGYLRNWWTDDDLAKFKERTKKLIDQYNKFEPLPGEHVNGELTIGENIGDLGGLSIAYKAYKASLDGKSSPQIDGFTGEQRVFLGWAQAWRSKAREEYLSKQLKTDPHSPALYRVNGVMPNIDAFYEAFDVKPGDGMYLPPEERVSIW
ncbi:M13 family metallopeptidase [Pseudoteredinibacter isoporae]|uniref:M13 family metallopeptidase n=1 Tax=Pseudoteredinibacter isoporae TaxID=570281 RepID=UPI003109B798